MIRGKKDTFYLVQRFNQRVLGERICDVDSESRQLRDFPTLQHVAPANKVTMSAHEGHVNHLNKGYVSHLKEISKEWQIEGLLTAQRSFDCVKEIRAQRVVHGDSQVTENSPTFSRIVGKSTEIMGDKETSMEIEDTDKHVESNQATTEIDHDNIHNAGIGKKTLNWVQQNLIKLGKIFRVDFQGHGEEAMELLLQIDSCRLAKRQEQCSGIKKSKTKEVQELKNLICFDVKFKSSGNRGKGRNANTRVEGRHQMSSRNKTRRQCYRGSQIVLGRQMDQTSIHRVQQNKRGDFTDSQTQDFKCHITGVYAPNSYKKRILVWEEVGAVRGLVEESWAVCGDFNAIRYIYEKKNCMSRTKGMKEFLDFIEDMKLVDLQLEDAASMIYRILISKDWDGKFQNLKQIPLQKLSSDHIPIALLGGSWERNKGYFKFENWWFRVEGLIDTVRDWWSSFNFTGKPDFILACKLRALKIKLKEYRKGEEGKGKLNH
ncbi:hypothetical protein H5410_042473 [Solanum commersonii]|uniref:Uncharacterized protein n=1 Tax=Solanum commersonii TaxID=4109 RepID=A0A9J5XWG6_SOLCO|nr:hypothetical protein H5410_042473 [Solanum commersonii]